MISDMHKLVYLRFPSEFPVKKIECVSNQTC